MRARWQRVRTNAGYHLRLVGANNEIVLSGEPLNNRDDVLKALAVAHRASESVAFAVEPVDVLDEVDERGKG